MKTPRLLFLALNLFVTVGSLMAQQKPVSAGFHTDALDTGANEYQIWTGYSPTSDTVLGKAEARRLFQAGFGYRRVILAGNSVAWKFTIDVIPLALISQPTIILDCNAGNVEMESVTAFRNSFGACIRTSRRPTYGAGFAPIGFEFNFRRRHRLQPIGAINAGVLRFSREVPIEGSASINFTVSAGGGMQIFTSESRSVTIGYHFHHISNADSGTPFNPGVDSNFFYAGYSFHK